MPRGGRARRKRPGQCQDVEQQHASDSQEAEGRSTEEAQGRPCLTVPSEQAFNSSDPFAFPHADDDVVEVGPSGTRGQQWESREQGTAASTSDVGEGMQHCLVQASSAAGNDRGNRGTGAMDLWIPHSSSGKRSRFYG